MELIVPTGDEELCMTEFNIAVNEPGGNMPDTTNYEQLKKPHRLLGEAFRMNHKRGQLQAFKQLFCNCHFLFLGFFLYSADLNEVFTFDAGFFHDHFVVEFTHHLHFLCGSLGAFHFGFVRTG
jgi:hypothetical protein